MSLRGDIAAPVVAAAAAQTPPIAVQQDPNLAFDPPADAPWWRIAFQDGAESMVSIGGSTSLSRQPVLIYVDIFTPIGVGDGPVTEQTELVKNALRRLVVPGARWKWFQEGAEGRIDSDYRKQVIAVFWRTRRV